MVTKWSRQKACVNKVNTMIGSGTKNVTFVEGAIG